MYTTYTYDYSIILVFWTLSLWVSVMSHSQQAVGTGFTPKGPRTKASQYCWPGWRCSGRLEPHIRKDTDLGRFSETLSDAPAASWHDYLLLRRCLPAGNWAVRFALCWKWCFRTVQVPLQPLPSNGARRPLRLQAHKRTSPTTAHPCFRAITCSAEFLRSYPTSFPLHLPGALLGGACPSTRLFIAISCSALSRPIPL